MGFFGGSDHITHHEFKKALYHLKEKEGFSEHQLGQIKETFRGDLDEEGSGSGISKEELRKGIHWLKEHLGSHHLSQHNIDTLEEVLRHYL